MGAGRVPIAIGIAILGLVFVISRAMAFKQVQTTVNPRRPEGATSLVVVGIYRITRNPMYVGLLFVLLGWATFLASPISLAGPVAFIAYITKYQIKPEERILLEKFGREYEQYMSRVRRWI